MLLAEGFDARRKRPGETLTDEPADQPGVTGTPSKPLTPPITATSANGPIASVPAPQVGAPSKQPVLQAPQSPAPQSVAQVALGTSETAQFAPKIVNNATPPQTGGYDPGTALPAAQAPTPQVGAPSTGGAFPGADGKGAVSGGTDGTGWATFDQSQAAPMSEADMTLYKRIGSGDQALMNQYKQQYGGDWLSKWNADQDRLTTAFNNQTNAAGIANLSGKSGAEAWSVIGSNLQNLNAIRAMTPEQRTQFLDQWPAGSYDRQLIEGSLAAQGITAASGDTGQRWDGTTQNNGPMASAVPVYQQTQAGTVNSQGLPGYGSSGPTPAVGAPESAAARPGGVRDVPTGGAGGGGGAPAVGVGPSGTPAFPSTPSLPAPSVGTPGDLTNLDPVQQAMRDETLRRLQNPSPYDDALWQKEVDRAKASSDEQWKRGRDALDADLAARGINWSSIAGDKLSDFNTAKARSWDDVLTGFLSDRAKGIGAARDQAFNAGSTERNYYDNLRQQAIANQFDVTKLAEALRQGREGTALDWTKLGLDALGGSTSGSADLAAGAAASAGNTGVGDYLAQWLAQFYGNKAPKPAVGTPAPAMAGAYG